MRAPSFPMKNKYLKFSFIFKLKVCLGPVNMHINFGSPTLNHLVIFEES